MSDQFRHFSPGFEDRARQSVPRLLLGEGRASTTQIVITLAAGMLIVFGVLYGINNQRVETIAKEPAAAQTAAAPPANTQAQQNAPPASPPTSAGAATTGSGENPQQPAPR